MSIDEKIVDIDRSGWPPGPWDGEPDKVQWMTRAGYAGLIVRNNLGAWCGYVGVPNGHPAYEKGYDDVEADVHGGLTYADKCAGEICHVPEPGQPDDVWWLGFDCIHAGDCPSARARPHTSEVYRDVHYVKKEVESLAYQLKKQEPK